MFENMTLYTTSHVTLSVLALSLGVLALYQLANAVTKSKLVVAYWAMSALTTATGFGFPFVKFLPSHIIGVLSTLSLIAMAFSGYRLKSRLGSVAYVVSTSITVYFLTFVATAQVFTKVPALNAHGPGIKGTPFIVVQTLVLAIFIGWTSMILRAHRRRQAGPMLTIPTEIR
jgi:hypothetical protein